MSLNKAQFDSNFTIIVIVFTILKKSLQEEHEYSVHQEVRFSCLWSNKKNALSTQRHIKKQKDKTESFYLLKYVN